MKKTIYDIEKNKKISQRIDWLIVSNYSPLSKELDDFDSIKNLVLINNDNGALRKPIFSNVENIYIVTIDYKNDGVDYGIVLNFFSKLEISPKDFICIDSTNLILPIYSYIYAYIKDIIKCNKVWFIYHEARIYKDPYKHKYHSGPITTVELECFRGTQNIKDELIVYLIGFEEMLTLSIDRDKEPAKKIVINGFPSYLLSYKDISLVNNNHLFVNNFSLDYCTASNPFQTYNKLLSIYNKHKDKYKITIAACGSTPSSIGAVIFAESIDEVNIITTRPESYKYERRDYKNRWLYKFED